MNGVAVRLSLRPGPLLTLIASATDRELAKYALFLKEENKILRSRLGPEVDARSDERQRMLQFGMVLGRAIKELITIISISTFYRWCRDEKDGQKTPNPNGGQRKPRQIRKLVIEIARVTGFSYREIIGELRKLGIKGISRQTVRNILKEEDIQPGPRRSSSSSMSSGQPVQDV